MFIIKEKNKIVYIGIFILLVRISNGYSLLVYFFILIINKRIVNFV